MPGGSDRQPAWRPGRSAASVTRQPGRLPYPETSESGCETRKEYSVSPIEENVRSALAGDGDVEAAVSVQVAGSKLEPDTHAPFIDQVFLEG